MAAVKISLPDCGLHRTTQALPGHEEDVPAGTLVYFHNHSDPGLPQVVLPGACVHNRWRFPGPGQVFRSLTWASSLRRLPAQGFYSLDEDLAFDGGSWPRHTLVQLGYTRHADPILFIGQQRAAATDNVLHFSDRGVRIDPEVLEILVALTVFREQADDHDDLDVG